MAPEQLVIELDEVWSFVGNKETPVWVSFALERSTRRILSWVVGDRSQETAFRLWDTYNEPLLGTHRLIGKAFTTHVERFNTTLRQQVGRLVRKTLSFSKSLPCLHAALALFIHTPNTSR